MPRHCSAGGCKSRDNRETRNAGITFHKLPKGTTRRNLWITNSHRTDSWDPQTDFVYFCSKHFTPESFELTGCSGIRRLKEDAFPTLFDSSAEPKRRGPRTHHKRGNIHIRKNPRSAKPELVDQESVEEAAEMTPTTHVQNSVIRCGNCNPSKETTECFPAAPQETSEVEQLSQQERSPSSQPISRPHSPSRYMRRLPPPPGFYLPKEHSYAQICPLLWRKRYNQAIDCLEKVLQQLRAARRRENRLRSTVLRLRDKRLKHTLLVSRDGPQYSGSWANVENRQSKGCGNRVVSASYQPIQQQNEMDAKCEDTRLYEGRFEEKNKFVGHFLIDNNSWSEDEGGYCFYCGRGRVRVEDQVGDRAAKARKAGQPTVQDDSIKSHKTAENCLDSYGVIENSNDMQIVRLEVQHKKSVEATLNPNSGTNLNHFPQILLQTHGPGLQQVIPVGPSLQEADAQSLQTDGGCQQEFLLSDTCENSGQQQDEDLQTQQLFWIRDSPEGQVILVPVPAEDGLKSSLWKEGAHEDAQTILVSGLGFKRDAVQTTENCRDDCLENLSREVGVEFACDDHEQHSNINSNMEIKEDVREKLKEHLEGFHLQLSTDFIN
ncbi:hypothetical protein LDENG_00253490 [Lucifuga dentata]|nr:hypothetical protein LDENG_00253490 [Lucifuga dentata]